MRLIALLGLGAGALPHQANAAAGSSIDHQIADGFAPFADAVARFVFAAIDFGGFTRCRGSCSG
jgi:hypothetical protein